MPNFEELELKPINMNNQVEPKKPLLPKEEPKKPLLPKEEPKKPLLPKEEPKNPLIKG